MHFFESGMGAEKKGEYLLLGDIKEGWKVFTMKKCSACHSIWGEGGKEGPDLGTLPQSYVSQSQLAALMWNHWPEMWGRMTAKKIPLQKMDKKEMADLFAFLYFIRYMDEPGNPQKGKMLMETSIAVNVIPCKRGSKGGSQPLGNVYQSNSVGSDDVEPCSSDGTGDEEERAFWVEFKGNEMVDLIAYIRSLSPKTEKVYLSPGDPQSGEKLFTQKGCIQCHSPRGELDLSKKKDFPRTLAQLAGMMWNHSTKCGRGWRKKGWNVQPFLLKRWLIWSPISFQPNILTNRVILKKGKTVFVKKQCNLCHAKGTKTPNLSGLKGQISPIFMAQTMWNHGPEMFEKMRKAKVPWQKIDGKEMVDLMEYLNRGMP